MGRLPAPYNFEGGMWQPESGAAQTSPSCIQPAVSCNSDMISMPRKKRRWIHFFASVRKPVPSLVLRVHSHIAPDKESQDDCSGEEMLYLSVI
mmetsp:Transcript_4748/g.7390  ORF Transcript_4748/g.7390 Transcript_4748/m.7390 type:complete len:93 (+) Transcript_4748:735-1013(+)